MTTAPPGFNYAKAYGIESVAGAVIFAILYVPLILFYIRQSFARPTYVYIVLAFFCAVVYNVGFFGLLYSAYTLVLDRGLLSDAPLPDGPISRITRRRPLFRMALAAAVAVGITGAIESATGSTQNTVNLGNTLRQVAIYIFLVLCVLVAFQTILLVRAEASYGTHKVSNGAFGATHGIHILCLISLLLLGREAFFVATANDLAKQNDENWWYPLAALTELVAVVMFSAPGLVPSRDELPS
ncbi:hypothetical protein PAXINDRAFT_13013 [Paxillus involutus ATCC 200175]|uniref:Uncharacterized protein n=1 Tax=Paxillus involutus ATCC 200175 TaxID=664439 RepID=A0A0C9TV15_PAXIN|nr:hypothetical protein PAXINDRAFT_13013 [Paxillus involutus ATCC 200175]